MIYHFRFLWYAIYVHTYAILYVHVFFCQVRKRIIILLKLTLCVWHDDVIKWKHFPRYWLFVRGIHRSPVNSPLKGQWRGFDVFFDLRLNKRLSKQWWGWWFKAPSRSLWCHCNEWVTNQVNLYMFWFIRGKLCVSMEHPISVKCDVLHEEGIDKVKANSAPWETPMLHYRRLIWQTHDK